MLTSSLIALAIILACCVSLAPLAWALLPWRPVRLVRVPWGRRGRGRRATEGA